MPIGMRDELVAEREFFPQPTLKSYKSQEKQEVKIAKIQNLYYFDFCRMYSKTYAYIGCGISSSGIQNKIFFLNILIHIFERE